MLEKLNPSRPPRYERSTRDFYRGRKVLVAGADGFLGMNCVRALGALQADVSVITRRQTPRIANFQGQIFRGDLREISTARAAAAGQSIVFDFIGTMGAVESNRNPVESLNQECTAQLSLFQACACAPIPPVVLFCSSRLVYGKPQYLPVDEDHPLNPQSIYAAHKITAESYLRVFGQTHHLPYCILRLSNPYGPYQAKEKKSYGIINRFLRAAAGGETIRIFGDGHQLRDYLHVDDVVIAFLLAGMTGGAHGEIFNLGGRNPVSLRSAAERIAELAGGAEVRYEPWPSDQQAVETGDYVTDASHIDSILHLPPEVTWDEGLRDALEYYRLEYAEAGASSNGASVLRPPVEMEVKACSRKKTISV